MLLFSCRNFHFQREHGKDLIGINETLMNEDNVVRVF